jgi:hypothetical protein
MVPHVDLLGMLFIVWGLLTTLVGVRRWRAGVGAAALITANRTEGGEFAATDCRGLHRAGDHRDCLGRRSRRGWRPAWRRVRGRGWRR